MSSSLEKAKEIRVNSLKMIHAAASGHPGGSLSISDILAVLYFRGHLKHDPKNPELADRDYLVVSKGHSSPAVYSALGVAGFFPIEDTISFRQLGSNFQGHIDRMRVPGVEMSTGSLGHGLSNALGIALGSKIDELEAGVFPQRKIFCILSDGELQEGSNWEAAMACAHYRAANIIAFVDRNRIQLDGWTESTMSVDPLADKFKAFGWNVLEIDGHDHDAIDAALNQAYDLAKEEQPFNKDSKLGTDKVSDDAVFARGGKPTMIIANTSKGKGVSFMEDQVAWHGVAPKDEDLEKALAELNN